MNKIFFLSVFMAASVFATAQIEMRTPKPTSSVKKSTSSGETFVNGYKPLPSRAFSINPLGVLQFGPVGQGEFRVSDNGYVTAHIRLPYLGLLYHLITIDERSDENHVSPLALGLGGGYKAMFPAEKGAWYVGGVADISYGSSSGNDGSEWKSQFGNVALMGNGGFRWRSSSKNTFLSLGGYIGVALPFRDEWWYKSAPADKRDERAIMPMAMLELAFGWER